MRLFGRDPPQDPRLSMHCNVKIEAGPPRSSGSREGPDASRQQIGQHGRGNASSEANAPAPAPADCRSTEEAIVELRGAACRAWAPFMIPSQISGRAYVFRGLESGPCDGCEECDGSDGGGHMHTHLVLRAASGRSRDRFRGGDSRAGSSTVDTRHWSVLDI